VKVFVSGGTGFTGQRVVADLLERGHSVTCLVRETGRREVLAERDVAIVVGDLGDREGLATALAGHDALVNVASIGFGHGPGIVAAAGAAGVSRAVFFSTTAIFTSLPAATRSVRLAAEAAVTGSSLDWTILRPTMIYGAPGDRNVERLLAAVARWPVLPSVGGGGRLIQPVLVDDLARVPGQVLDAPVTIRRSYSIPGREAVTFESFVRAAGAASGRRVRLVPVPPVLALAAASVLQRVMPNPKIRREQVERLLEDKDFDWDAAETDFGYDPAGVEEGLRLEVSRLRQGRAAK
jgi:uncharacterized protein YbjT (DUF2867 family)